MPESRFERKRSVSQYWYNKASDLMGAAATVSFSSSNKDTAEKIVMVAGLGSEFDLSIATHRIFYMLCGMALELAYKAILVEEGKEPPMNHDLVELAKLTGMQTTVADESLLKIWSQLIIWDGKYPIPKKEEQMNMYDNLINTMLWSSIDGTIFQHRNNHLGWLDFRVFWDQASERYFSACNRRQLSD